MCKRLSVIFSMHKIYLPVKIYNGFRWMAEFTHTRPKIQHKINCIAKAWQCIACLRETYQLAARNNAKEG